MLFLKWHCSSIALYSWMTWSFLNREKMCLLKWNNSFFQGLTVSFGELSIFGLPMIPPGNEGVNVPQMDTVGSLKGWKAFVDFTEGFLVAPLELLVLTLHCNFVLKWRNIALWSWKPVTYMFCLTYSIKTFFKYEISYRNIEFWLLKKKKKGIFHVNKLAGNWVIRGCPSNPAPSGDLGHLPTPSRLRLKSLQVVIYIFIHLTNYKDLFHAKLCSRNWVNTYIALYPKDLMESLRYSVEGIPWTHELGCATCFSLGNS